MEGVILERAVGHGGALRRPRQGSYHELEAILGHINKISSQKKKKGKEERGTVFSPSLHPHSLILSL